jgi:hypothetical protein
MPRPRILTDEERRLKLNERARKQYHKNNPSIAPRILRLQGLSEADLEALKAKQEYFKAYYKINRENILTKANQWHKDHKGLAQITTIE